MEYIYAVMLLNKAGKDINEDNVVAVLKAAGVEADAAKAKSLVAALDGVNIEEIIANSAAVAATTVAAAGAAPTADAGSAPAAEEKKKEEAPAVDASAGLGDLF